MQKFHHSEPLGADVEAVEAQGQNNHIGQKADEHLPALEDLNTGPETIIKKRLNRADSDYDLAEKTWIHKDHLRAKLIEKAENIFDFIIDDVKKNVMCLSAIISDVARFEFAWAKYIDLDNQPRYWISYNTPRCNAHPRNQ